MEAISITPKERYQLVINGVATAELKEFMQTFKLNQKQMAQLLAVSDKTLYAQLKGKRLDQNLSDRFLLIQSVFVEGVDALMSADIFRRWLDTPHRGFEELRPITLMSTINGAEAVRSELIRTKHGILS